MNTFKQFTEETEPPKKMRVNIPPNPNLYQLGIDYLKDNFLAAPYHFRWNPKNPISPGGNWCIFAVRDQKIIYPYEPFTLRQRGISEILPISYCDFPSFTWTINLADNLSVIEAMINTDKSPFSFNSGDKNPMQLQFRRPWDLRYDKDRPSIKDIEEDSKLVRSYQIFNFYENISGIKAVRVVRTLEFASQFIKNTKGYWSDEDAEALVELKMKYLKNDQLTMKDWATAL